MFKIEFYVPLSHLESVKTALFESGAGKIGDYEHCCWQTEGRGQFRPGADSHPFRGKGGTLEVLKEWKVELVCADGKIEEALSALLQSHPYEEPAFSYVKINDKNTFL